MADIDTPGVEAALETKNGTFKIFSLVCQSWKVRVTGRSLVCPGRLRYCLNRSCEIWTAVW
jgi:hypothetical protein